VGGGGGTVNVHGVPGAGWVKKKRVLFKTGYRRFDRLANARGDQENTGKKYPYIKPGGRWGTREFLNAGGGQPTKEKNGGLT